MIIETIFSTLDATGQPNFAPMGVVWGETEMTVRPFRDTTTCRNLVTTGYGVANVTDNVLSFAHSALSPVQFPHFPARHVPGVVLEEACCWRELEVITVGGSDERAEIRCRVVGQGRQRDLLGFNRGKNAVIEAAILATRLHLHSQSEVWAAFQRYDEIVAKTGGEQEREAMQYLHNYVRRWFVAGKS
jgi:hypothetical protein